jgi:hypothetical protein
MLKLKAAGVPKWYQPSSLTSGGRFANKSPAVLARQAAHGMLATTPLHRREASRVLQDALGRFQCAWGRCWPSCLGAGLGWRPEAVSGHAWHWLLLGEQHGYWVRLVGSAVFAVSPFAFWGR